MLARKLNSTSVPSQHLERHCSTIHARSHANCLSALQVPGVGVAIVLLLALYTSIARGEEETAVKEREQAMSTAVALNYCRAAFHRIRKNPTDEVLKEEEEKILNNLNLSKMEDPEVVSLYTSVLDEISEIGVAEKERDMFTKHHRTSITRQITWDALALGADLATGQFGNAVRTGANSWWDYRDKAFRRDMDIHKIDKTRINEVVKRSTQFLDTFWKLAQKKNIPDSWLVRGEDLDQLEVAMQEQDPEVRLRVLSRMEPFMEAYPPYWYYVGRTKQELGELTAAVETYSQLASIGEGYFRRDDMLSTAMANQAAIQDFMGDPMAVASARKSLEYSSDVWEANLVAARVLQRHGQIADAEDAILRNLDVGLEESKSTVFLASLYYFTRDDVKVANLLKDPKAVARLPAPVLIRCASLVGPERTPAYVTRNIESSLTIQPRVGLGSQGIVLRMSNAWQLHLADLNVLQDGEPLPEPQISGGRGYHELAYNVDSERSSLLGRQMPKELTIRLQYPEETDITLVLREDAPNRFSPSFGQFANRTGFHIADVRLGSENVQLRQEAYLDEMPNSAPLRKTAELLGHPATPAVEDDPTLDDDGETPMLSQEQDEDTVVQ